uniref:RanBD1 domain-containing protein n=1 Tax=Rhabditophanes sp. KR3021 TaxID=114890 RepID=A0AC35U7R4_9BILA
MFCTRFTKTRVDHAINEIYLFSVVLDFSAALMDPNNITLNCQSFVDEKSSIAIVDQISCYIKANTIALNDMFLFVQKEASENRRQFYLVKDSLESVHDGLDILANRVLSMDKTIGNGNFDSDVTQKRNNSEVDHLVRLVENLTVKQDGISTVLQLLKQQTEVQQFQQQQQQAGMAQLMAMRPDIQQQQQQQQVALMQAAQMYAQQQQHAAAIQQQNILLQQQHQQSNPISMMQAMANSQRPMAPNPMFQNVNATHMGQGSNVLPMAAKPFVQPTPSVIPAAQVSAVNPVEAKPVEQGSALSELLTNLDAKKKSEMSESKPVEAASIFGNAISPSKPNLFGNVSVNPSNKPFSFAPTAVTNPIAQVEEKDECPEDYECNANFEPVIPLPDLVKVTTGEEDEVAVFTSRAKLFKFIDGKEFKERGVGDLKILKHNTSGKTRVVMRRDQTFKVCANFAISTGMTVSLKANTTKVVIFSCYDTSDETPGHATFCLKFGEEASANRFMEEFGKAESGTESSPLVKEAAPKKFEPKVEPKVEQIEELKKSSSFIPQSPTQPETDHNESDYSEDEQEDEEDDYDEEENEDVQDPNYYKVKEALPGSWACKECYITNKPDIIECVACSTSKDGSAAKPVAKSLFAPTTFTSTTSSPFSFGFNAKTDTKLETPATPKVVPSLAKEAEEKNTPFSMNTLSESLIDKSTSSSLFDKPNPISTFSFASKASNAPAAGNIFGDKPFSFEAKPTGKSIFDTTEPKPNFFGGSKDTAKPSVFGGSTNVSSNASTSVFGSNSFGASTKPKEVAKPFELSAKPAEQYKPKEGVKIFGASTFPEMKVDFSPKQPVVSNTETTPKKAANIFGSGLTQTSTSFSDVVPANGGFLNNSGAQSNLFNIKASDHKLFASPKPVTEDGDDHVEEYESDAHFEPVIPLPDKIEVVTGEEDETEIHRIHTKLFIMNTAEKAWKERGTGILKVLKDNKSEKYRIIMRRDQVHNICANMPLAARMTFNSTEMRPKMIVFKAFDFSDDIDNGVNGTYAIKFNNVEEAKLFSKATNECVAKLSQS